MATPRSLVVDPSKSGVFHCVSRCVRRAFLCGRDFYSGRDYEHRRGWVRERLKELAGLFGVEICSYNVMSNHLHVVVRTRPDRVAEWADEEVARRWLQLFPGPGKAHRRDAQGRLRPPEEADIRELCRDSGKLAVRRARLANLSWFMRCLNEPIARRANEEDDCTGRFWEGRFKCEKLDDEGALLACMSYVDLNPVRAGIAATPEESDFTSVQDRIAARQARRQLDQAPEEPTPEQAVLIAQTREEATRDHWLVPLGGNLEVSGEGPAAPCADEAPCSASGGAAAELPRPVSPPRPPSLLPDVSEDQYLELLDWTGRQIRAGKRGHISPHLRPVLERLDLDVEAWVDNVQRYGGLFYRVAGKLQRLRELAGELGSAWLRGQRGARRLYAAAA